MTSTNVDVLSYGMAGIALPSSIWKGYQTVEVLSMRGRFHLSIVTKVMAVVSHKWYICVVGLE